MELNFLAIAVAALVPLIVGLVYFHPAVLGGPWMRVNGFTLESIGKGPNPILYVVALGLSFLLSMFVCINVTGPGQDAAPDGHSYATFGHGTVHGVMISLLVLLPVLGTMSIFEKRGWGWVFTNLGYWMLTLAIMGGILSAWR